MDARLRRVNKEIADCKNDKTSNIKIELIDESPFHLKGSFPGPEGTPYEGGKFEVVSTYCDLTLWNFATTRIRTHPDPRVRILSFRNLIHSSPSR